MNDEASSDSIRCACGRHPDKHGRFSPIAMVDAFSIANPDGVPDASWPRVGDVPQGWLGETRIDYIDMYMYMCMYMYVLVGGQKRPRRRGRF